MQRAQRTRVWAWQAMLILLLIVGAAFLFYSGVSRYCHEMVNLQFPVDYYLGF